MANPVTISSQDGIATITLNRPERLNAFDCATIDALGAALATANADDEVGVVILTGAGDRAFSAGKDLDDNDDLTDRDTAVREVEALQELTRRIVGSPKIYIAAVNGWAVGGGFEISLNCDLSIWAEKATAFMPELKWGLYPSGASTAAIARRAGSYAALEMLLFEQRIGARRLQELGLAWRVVPDGQALAEARSVAAKILTLPKAGVANFKAAVNESLYGNVEDVLQAEIRALLMALADPETPARIAAFAKGAG